MKKIFSVALAAMMAASLLVGCGGGGAGTTAAPAGTTAAVGEGTTAAKDTTGGESLVVGYAQVGAESDWRTANTTSFKDTFVEANGYTLIFDDAQQKQENQIKAIRNFIQQEVDYIVLAPVVETGWETVLGEAKEAGIPVILSDRQIQVTDESLYVCWVGGNFILEGEKAADWLAAYLTEQGRDKEDINIVLLQGTIGASAQIGRTDGFKGKLTEHANWKLLAEQTGEFTQTKGQEVMESFLKQYEDIDVVIAENDNMAFGAVDAIKAVGKTPGKDIIIISYDSVKAAFESVIAGDINCTVECNPLHGPRVDEIIKKLEKGEEVEKIQYVDEGVFDIKNAEKELPNRLY